MVFRLYRHNNFIINFLYSYNLLHKLHKFHVTLCVTGSRVDII
jgi:hypothetical protein